MVKENENLQSSYLNEEELRITPRIKQHTAVVRSISSVPAVKGYIGVTAKDDATVVLTVNGDPLYAEWTYGEGKVASFMSDLGRTWTSKYFSDERGKKFVLNVVNNLSTVSSTKTLSISATQLSWIPEDKIREVNNKGWTISA